MLYFNSIRLFLGSIHVLRNAFFREMLPPGPSHPLLHYVKLEWSLAVIDGLIFD